ncbi:MAG: DEAD/DEAH box helicase, partial [Synechococcus sp.]|nr:DEAD/DEAH box helicase [Synechococcus sp.]
MASSPKIIVFDDDPTGSQTVRGCPLLLEFSTANLQSGLADSSPLLFLLTNSRALEPEQVRQELTALCRRLKPLLAQLTRPWLVVSRGDSTLRGHTPLELEVIRAELGPFAANVLVPAFPQGGRITRDGVHLLHGEPLHHSAFARDQRFGYPSSDLPQWLEHKTAGLIQANVVVRLKPAESLAELKTGQWAVLDASSPIDLDVIGEQVLAELGAIAAERPQVHGFANIEALVSGVLRRSDVVGAQHLDAIPREFVDLPATLAGPIYNALRSRFPDGLYLAQVKALEAAHRGDDVVQLTSTASGKSVGLLYPALAQAAEGKNSLVVTPRNVLPEQYLNEFKESADQYQELN